MLRVESKAAYREGSIVPRGLKSSVVRFSDWGKTREGVTS